MSLEITITDLEELKTHLADCLAVSIQKQLDPIIQKADGAAAKVDGLASTVATHAQELANLKANQAKALCMWTIMIGLLGTGVTLGFNYIKGFIAAHLHLS